MEIKRNIFNSSARMPERYEPMAVPMAQVDSGVRTDQNTMPFLMGAKPNSSIKHARVPRVGEQK